MNPEIIKLGDFKEGLIIIRMGNNYGFMNENDEIVIEPIYEEVLEFSENLAGFKLNGRWGFR
ncbi:WG repeat-containing protein [Campylobacter lari]|uniref:WG repeat-containing protein n=1 Tax=Campylobacter lari TaxID=201 RepID=UPI00142A272A|nr:WG repeat-containing protein [Campylobacter lari]EAJ1270143.1 WG repeat-containing protein [Campylobacter lari]EAK5529368.1 WG repeat-containing protein [Campylobacter lari]EDP6837450.1 hypothetical protein [Campylobacter lari]MCR2058639.1 WG repeat-containing protein [Campylobacter lari subsp. concheus]